MRTYGERIDPTDLVLTEKLVNINRVAKVVKGGRRFSFNALVVVGDGKGHVGMGLGKAKEVPSAIHKGTAIAKKNLIRVSLRGITIPYKVTTKFGAARVMLRPAAPGTGVIAGGGIRAVVEAAGIQDILTKSLGSSNPINVVHATIKALHQLRLPEEELARRKPGARARAAPLPQAAASTAAVAKEAVPSVAVSDKVAKEAEAPAEERKAEAPAEEKEAEAPAEEKEAEAPADEKEAEAPADEKEAEAPADEKEAEAPADEKKAEAPADEKEEEAPANEKEEKAPAKEKEAKK